ncbi:DUF6401 family natural product biosynthesis protein [Jiangella gansuensis]|uniref:DUF6401 family natural product biosynthesis protein n=1 Tax=Jiangella gansuensis TaxID=281473 RepID=UPI00047CF523|nr:DUF6401 family natural product biosynthesis protein [Jiangella gansuensis]
MNWFAPRRRTTAARRELASLADRLGIAAGGDLPAGVVAEIDQHAAAVRDILVFSGAGVGPVELAEYARGVEDVALEQGRSPGPLDRQAPDWVSLRLAAVCALATAGSAMASVADGDIDPLMYP